MGTVGFSKKRGLVPKGFLHPVQIESDLSQLAENSLFLIAECPHQGPRCLAAVEECGSEGQVADVEVVIELQKMEDILLDRGPVIGSARGGGLSGGRIEIEQVVRSTFSRSSPA